MLRFLSALLFMIPTAVLSSTELPSALPEGFTSWSMETHSCTMNIGGEAKFYLLELYSRKDKDDFQAVEIHRLNGEAFLTTNFSSKADGIGFKVKEKRVFVRAHDVPLWKDAGVVYNGVSDAVWPKIDLIVDKIYLAKEQVSMEGIRKCIRKSPKSKTSA